MKTRKNRKIRNLNQTGAGDEIIEKNTLTNLKKLMQKLPIQDKSTIAEYRVYQKVETFSPVIIC